MKIQCIYIPLMTNNAPFMEPENKKVPELSSNAMVYLFEDKWQEMTPALWDKIQKKYPPLDLFGNPINEDCKNC